MQGILELDIVSGSGVSHGTPDFEALSKRSNYRRESQSTVAGPPSCAGVALRRRLLRKQNQCVSSARSRSSQGAECGVSDWGRNFEDALYINSATCTCAYTKTNQAKCHIIYIIISNVMDLKLATIQHIEKINSALIYKSGPDMVHFVRRSTLHTMH